MVIPIDDYVKKLRFSDCKAVEAVRLPFAVRPDGDDDDSNDDPPAVYQVA